MYQDYYSTPGVRKICHDIKQLGDLSLKNEAVHSIADYFIRNFSPNKKCYLVPAPQHSGDAEYTKDICKVVSFKTEAEILDIVKCKPHKPLYEQKYEGKTSLDADFYLSGNIPEEGRFLFVDNVISSGETFKRIDELFLGKLEPMVYAVDFNRLEDKSILRKVMQSMKITDSWNEQTSGGNDLYFTVQVDLDRFVDVKYPNFSGDDFHQAFSYVMDCEQGGQIYAAATGPDGIGVGTLTNVQEGTILEFVSEEAKDFLDSHSMEKENRDAGIFKKNDIVVAKDGFLDKGETLKDTVGIVLDYNPQNDMLVLGSLHPEKYALPPRFSMRGEFYRPVNSQELKDWGLLTQDVPKEKVNIKDMIAKNKELVKQNNKESPENEKNRTDMAL